MKSLIACFFALTLAFAYLPVTVSPTTPTFAKTQEPRFGAAPGYAFSTLVASANRCQFALTQKSGTTYRFSQCNCP